MSLTLRSDDGDNEKVPKSSCQYEFEMNRITEMNTRIYRLSVSSSHFEQMQYLEEFTEISKCLSSLLPPVSNKSLFDVDELLYQEQIKEAKKSVLEEKALFCHIDANLYSQCYNSFVRKGVRNIFMDTALMELMQHMPVLFENLAYKYLLKLKDVYSTCIALKIIIAGAYNQYVKFNFDTCERSSGELQLYGEYLTKIPLGYSSNGRRLSEFISKHAALFLTLAKDPNIRVNGLAFFKVSIVKMISERCFPADKHILNLIDTFVNFNSTEREQLPIFLFKLMEGTDLCIHGALKRIGLHKDNKTDNLSQKLMRIIIDHIITNSYNLGRKLLKIEEKMELIDTVFGYKIEPYFSKNHGDKCHAFNKASSSNEAFGFNKEFTSFEEFPVRKLSFGREDHMIFEKFFVYDEFMRSLHCLSIFHELFVELERRFEVKYDQCYAYHNFWNMVTTCGLVPWYVKMIVMKCPFLFKSRTNNIAFNAVTSEEKEFIDSQNWKIKISMNKNPDGYKYVDPENGRALPLPGRPCYYNKIISEEEYLKLYPYGATILSSTSTQTLYKKFGHFLF